MPIETWEAAGAKLRVRISGQGTDTFLLATDPPNVLEHYAELAVALGRHGRVVVFEPPGFGRSTAPKGWRYSFEENAEILIALAERLGGRVLPALACVGAYAGLVAASRRPDLFPALVAMQAPSWREEMAWLDRIDRHHALRTPIVGQAMMSLRAESVATRWYDAAVGNREKVAMMRSFGVDALSHGARFPLADALQAASKSRALDGLRIEQPVLHVWGDADRTHKRSDPESLREHAPRLTVARIEGAGHFPELEAPARFADIVSGWRASL